MQSNNVSSKLWANRGLICLIISVIFFVTFVSALYMGIMAIVADFYQSAASSESGSTLAHGAHILSGHIEEFNLSPGNKDHAFRTVPSSRIDSCCAYMNGNAVCFGGWGVSSMSIDKLVRNMTYPDPKEAGFRNKAARGYWKKTVDPNEHSSGVYEYSTLTDMWLWEAKNPHAWFPVINESPENAPGEAHNASCWMNRNGTFFLMTNAEMSARPMIYSAEITQGRLIGKKSRVYKATWRKVPLNPSAPVFFKPAGYYNDRGDYAVIVNGWHWDYLGKSPSYELSTGIWKMFLSNDSKPVVSLLFKQTDDPTLKRMTASHDHMLAPTPRIGPTIWQEYTRSPGKVRFYMYGGFDRYGNAMSDLWRFIDNRWTLLSTELMVQPKPVYDDVVLTPGPRGYAIPLKKRKDLLCMFGGTSDIKAVWSPEHHYADIWCYDTYRKKYFWFEGPPHTAHLPRKSIPKNKTPFDFPYPSMYEMPSVAGASYWYVNDDTLLAFGKTMNDKYRSWIIWYHFNEAYARGQTHEPSVDLSLVTLL